MSEIYQRRPAPPDWPRPEGLVTREVDRTTACSAIRSVRTRVVINEFYIEGTEPVQECNVHGPFGIIADSTRARRPRAAARSASAGSRIRVTPRAAPVPAPSRRPSDTARKTFRPVPSRPSRERLDARSTVMRTPRCRTASSPIPELIEAVRARGVRPSVVRPSLHGRLARR